MSRILNDNEVKLTLADNAFKQAILTDVELRLRTILPELVAAVIHDELGTWHDEVVETINAHAELLKQLTD